jgi:hypothetical protein
MEEKKTCPACGTELDPDRLEDLCPRCLLEEGMEEPPVPDGEAFAVPAAEDLAPLFPGLTILGFLGRGGMGAVYRVRHERLGRDLALKVVPRDPGGDGSFPERFLREAQVLAGLSHPGIVRVIDFGEAGPYLFLLMEFAGGGSLRSLLRQGRVEPERAVRIARDLCDALGYAHERGVVHRDVKPENVLLDERGHVSVADFGLVKVFAERPDSSLTGTRQILGTPHYMAPEQVERPAEVGPPTDVYAVGVLLYEMLTGRLPLGRFPVPSEVAESPVGLDDVVLRALDQDPARRPAPMEHLSVELEEALRDGPGAGAPEPPGPPRDPTNPPRQVPPSRDARGGKIPAGRGSEARFRRWVVPVACLGLAVFLVAFLPWMSYDADTLVHNLGAKTFPGGRIPPGRSLGAWTIRFDAWHLTFLWIPVWFTILPGILLAVLGLGEAAGLWIARAGAYTLTALVGGGLSLFALVDLTATGGTPNVGSILAVVLYGVAIWLVLIAERGGGARSLNAFRRRKKSVRRRRGRSAS